MKRSEQEMRSEGAAIAESLGNGVRYAGPQIINGKLEYHLFNDDAVTDGSFTGRSLKSAKKSFAALRQRFKAPAPK
jgi:hypothetical protein